MALSITGDNPWPFDRRAAIFDFDGTVADSLDVWRRVDDLFFEKRGLAYGPDYAEKLSVLGFEEGARYTIEAYGLNDTVQGICDEWNAMGRELYRTEVELRPGAEEYVRMLHEQGIAVGLATTNAPEVLAAMEGRVPLDELFPVQVYGCEVERGTKDHPDIFLECCRKLAVSPQDCVLFEDLPAAILTGKKLGMKTVGVLTNKPMQNVKLLTKAADYLITDWTGIL